MLEYKPKLSDENHNITKTSHYKEFANLLAGFLLITVGFYFLISFIFDFLIPHISPEQEKFIWRNFYLTYTNINHSLDNKSPKAIYLQKLVNKLESQLPADQKLKLTVYIQKSEEVNAFAVPGGYIIVLSGLLKKVKSENELAYVLAHEIGHFAHRDQIKGLGRQFILLFISQLFLGNDNPINKLTRHFLSFTETRFSQSQEINADTFALDLLNKTYKHISGCTDFMEGLQKEMGGEKLRDFFSTHPHPKKRIEIMNKLISNGNYKLGAKSPLNSQLN